MQIADSATRHPPAVPSLVPSKEIVSGVIFCEYQNNIRQRQYEELKVLSTIIPFIALTENKKQTSLEITFFICQHIAV